jgi:hypothetical protein
MPEKEYTSSIISALGGYGPNAHFDTVGFRAAGDYLDNDWTENPNGESYASRISEAGRPELLEWAGGRREAYRALARQW